MKWFIAIIGWVVLAVCAALDVLLALNGIATMVHGSIGKGLGMVLTASAIGFMIVLFACGLLDWADTTGRRDTPRETA